MPIASDSAQSKELAAPPAERRLYRSNTDRVIAGVCGGLGEYFAVDPKWFRIGLLLLVLGGGSGVLVYLLMWLIVPPQPEGDAAQAPVRTGVTGAVVVGVVFVFLGTVALVNTISPWLGQYFWPVALVIGGFALLMGGINRDNR
jgi:phage shock protein C